MPRVAEKRQSEANRIREKYPDRIPVSFYPPVCTASFFLIALIQFMTIFYNAGDCWEIPELKNHRRRLGLDHSSAISFFLPSCTSTASNRAKSTANSCPPPPCRLANPSCLEQCEAWLFIAFYAMQPHSPFTHAVHWNSSELFSWFCSELGLTVLRAMWRALIRERGAISCPV